MSTRIQELAAQAKAAVPAGLIVKECVAQCWTVSELESKGSVINECAKRIRKHFGVE